jgi:SAM-dependent methyltransferase
MSQHVDGLHVVQGDAYRLPVQPRFDFAYSVGVLQHILDPAAALRGMARVLAPGQRLVLWVYGVREAWYQPVEWLRRFTRRMPYPLVRALSHGLAILSELLLLVPYRILSRVPPLRRLAERIPGRIYARLPYRENVLGWFDRLIAPVTYYFSERDLRVLLEEAGFESVQLYARPDASASWVVSCYRS